MNFEKKYEKYKKKYLMLKNMVGGEEPSEVLMTKIENIYNSFINGKKTYICKISTLSIYLSYLDILFRRKYKEHHIIDDEKIADALYHLIVLYFDLYSITLGDKLEDVKNSIKSLKNNLILLGYNHENENMFKSMISKITSSIEKAYQDRYSKLTKNRRNMHQLQNYLNLLLK